MRNPFQKRAAGQVALLLSDGTDGICVPGYTSLANNPEIMTACRRIAEVMGSITIHLMNSTEDGDFRIENELSRKIDINPMPNMTRTSWVQFVVMTLLLYGNGNAVVRPVTENGYLRKLEPISGDRVTFMPIGYDRYKILIDGISYDPEDLIHVPYNPDRTYPWKGRGVTVSLREVANNLKQAQATTKGFLQSKWKPSVIVKVDAMTDEFSGKAGRKKLIDDYLSTDESGAPWIIPADQFSVEQIRPLSLNDLAISDTMEIDKRTVAAVLGVPPFLLGVGEYRKEAWNAFVQNTVRPIAIALQQELTKKLIMNPNWYLRFNTLSLLDWDLSTIASVYGSLSDRGFVTGNEVRDRIGMSPMDGLDELRILENYIPYDMSALQKKLIQEGENDE